jgi:hypothetical protein
MYLVGSVESRAIDSIWLLVEELPPGNKLGLSIGLVNYLGLCF